MGQETVATDEIGLGFVPRLRGDIEFVPVGDEAVLYEAGTGGMHQLDPIAAVVCGFIDGQRRLGEVIDELDQIFDESKTTIEADVLWLVRHLGGKGLLEGVAPADGEAPDGS